MISATISRKRRETDTMIRYVLKRIVLMIPTILITSLLIYWAMDLAGGDPVMTILPENATVEQQ